MNLLFLGASSFSVPFLDSLYCSTHNIPLVVTNPDAPRGRGKKMQHNPVKAKALELGIRVLETSKMDQKTMRSLRIEDLDAAVVVSLGIMLPPEFIKIFSGNCINVHPSLLPKYRGPTPISTTLKMGEKETGVSIMKINPQMDAGPLYSQTKFAIHPEDDCDRLKEKMVKFGSALLETTLAQIEDHNIELFAQDETKATYTKHIQKQDLTINWDEKAEEIANKIRAYSSRPGCFSFYKHKRVKFLKASAVSSTQQLKPGSVTSIDKQKGFFIQCGNNSALLVQKLQPEGKKPQEAIAFLHGCQLQPGDRFEARK